MTRQGVAAVTTIDWFLARQRRAGDAAMERIRTSLEGRGRVTEAMGYALGGGGKRIRPALCAACYEAIAGRPAEQSVAELGCAVELIHTYSLIHDDLPCMDDDDVRRGRATTHRVFGDEIAILAGAALIPLAFSTAERAAADLGLSDAVRREIAMALALGAGAAGMVGGQVMDLSTDARGVNVVALEQTHAAKTGALMSAACVLGALAAHASGQQLLAIRAYSRHLGLAFQITDDVLDETASTEELGKTAGKDREDAKATFPALLGVDGARKRARAEIDAAIAALKDVDFETDTLTQLGRFAVDRKR